MERRIEFIGLGNMGYPMAENFLKKFGQVMVYNHSQQKCLDLQKEGTSIASNLKELMEIYEETMIQVSEEPVNNISKPKILKKDNNN